MKAGHLSPKHDVPFWHVSSRNVAEGWCMRYVATIPDATIFKHCASIVSGCVATNVTAAGMQRCAYEFQWVYDLSTSIKY
jgi:hypothetical protein